jgi:hypothetical protein
LSRQIEIGARRIAFAVLALAFSTRPAIADRPPLDDLKWVHSDTDPVLAMTHAPAECLAVPPDVDRARLIQLGRVAFRSPVLLGGVAARIGLSCDSCHRNGHDNPAFFIAGVSGEPGTADVTGSVFSSGRDDQRRNPVPIPSLVDAAAHPPFGTVMPAPDLRTFLIAAITVEFQGQPPPPSILDGIAAYLGALESSACPSPTMMTVTFDAEARALLETVDVIVAALDRHDDAAAEFALLSLRAAIGRVYARFPADLLAREGLVELSSSLSRLRMRLEEAENAEVIRMLAAERERLEGVLGVLGKKTSASYYDAVILRRALEAPRGGSRSDN